MRRKICTTLFVFAFILGFSQNKEIRLPLTFHNNLGVSAKSRSSFPRSEAVAENDAVAKTCVTLKNIQMGEIEIYPVASFDGWNNSYRNTVKFIIGTDKDEKKQLMIDTNNNRNFGDETFFAADTADIARKNPIEKSSKTIVEYDWLINGKKTKQQLAIHITYIKEIDHYFYTFAHHATTELKSKKLEIIPSRDIEYLNFNVYDLSNKQSDGIKPNRYLVDNETAYLVKGIDINKNELVLIKEAKKLNDIRSVQVGFRPPAFSSPDIINKQMVSLDDYKGKYVYIDILASWCAPCIVELPKLKAIYDTVDKSKIEFISIIQKDKPEVIARIIEKSGLNWRIIEANDENHIFSYYRINILPTTLLINPEGEIIKYQMHSTELKRFIDNGYELQIEQNIFEQ